MSNWKRGLPPGKYYEGMVDDFEVYFTLSGAKWHRKRSYEERHAYIQQKEHNAAAVFAQSIRLSQETDRQD